MYAGSSDREWVDAMTEQAEMFRAKGLQVRFSIEPRQGHVMTSLEGAGAARLFDNFDQAANGCGK